MAAKFLEKLFAPFVYLLGQPTNPGAVPFTATEPEGLALIYTAPTAPEADLTRQMLGYAGFRVEYVPATTGVFGTTGSVHVYVHADEETEAREFLDELWEEPDHGSVEGSDDESGVEAEGQAE